MTPKTPLINELRARRDTLGWSLEAVAQHCGIDERFLDEWERGAGSPRLDALDCWAAALGLKLALASATDESRHGLCVDWRNRRITIDGSPVRLTPMEWKALERLAAAPGELVTHEALYRHLYGADQPYRTGSTAIRVLITKLRRLLPLRIEAQWGRGYVLRGVGPSSPPAGADGDTPTAPSATAAACAREGAAVARQPASLRPDRRLQALAATDPRVWRSPPPDVVAAHRAEELRVIERYLSERGATRCPDIATIQQSPLPTLVWDKVKRKWVRPSLTDRAAS